MNKLVESFLYDHSHHSLYTFLVQKHYYVAQLNINTAKLYCSILKKQYEKIPATTNIPIPDEVIHALPKILPPLSVTHDTPYNFSTNFCTTSYFFLRSPNCQS